MGRNFTIAPDEFYHIYNRGTDKRDIFLSTADYERFVGLLYACNGDKPVDLKLQGSTLYDFLSLDRGEEAVDICSYVLMPNHFHLLVRSRKDGDVSKFMQKLSTGYTMYFNTRHERSGSLFQGRFKARHASTDTYLAYVIAYIHLNPIARIEPTWKQNGIIDLERARSFLQDFRWSSYVDYLGSQRPEKALLSTSALPEYWHSPRSFEHFVTDWLTYVQIQKQDAGQTLVHKDVALALT